METHGDRRTNRRRIVREDASLDELRRHLEGWRARCRGPNGRIPEALWAAAVARARRDGVERIADALRLNGDALRRRVAAAAPPPAALRATPAFVELGLAAPAAQCQVEVEAPDGAKLSLRLTGAPPDLPGLLAAFLGRRA